MVAKVGLFRSCYDCITAEQTIAILNQYLNAEYMTRQKNTVNVAYKLFLHLL